MEKKPSRKKALTMATTRMARAGLTLVLYGLSPLAADLAGACWAAAGCKVRRNMKAVIRIVDLVGIPRGGEIGRCTVAAIRTWLVSEMPRQDEARQ
ncbi:hypothetical protein M5K25_017872 [Dendrobium thyrsiflorum]|uniref:Uncharacterized protein n=1 Tax=Dendrobium thyrsiflorum TaxID=117978 RepID=A0ABD0UH67_DENTH